MLSEQQDAVMQEAQTAAARRYPGRCCGFTRDGHWCELKPMWRFDNGAVICTRHRHSLSLTTQDTLRRLP